MSLTILHHYNHARETQNDLGTDLVTAYTRDSVDIACVNWHRGNFNTSPDVEQSTANSYALTRIHYRNSIGQHQSKPSTSGRIQEIDCEKGTIIQFFNNKINYVVGVINSPKEMNRLSAEKELSGLFQTVLNEKKDKATNEFIVCLTLEPQELLNLRDTITNQKWTVLTHTFKAMEDKVGTGIKKAYLYNNVFLIKSADTTFKKVNWKQVYTKDGTHYIERNESLRKDRIALAAIAVVILLIAVAALVVLTKK